MKALSIRQPWATLLAYGVKDTENRGWGTSYRGPLLLHAPKTLDEAAYAVYDRCRRTHAALPAWDELPIGGIVGIAELVDCVRESTSPWFCGPVGLVLRDARPLPFVALRGQLWLFDVPEALITHPAPR